MTTAEQPAPERGAYGVGIATISDIDGSVLDVHYQRLDLGWDATVQKLVDSDGPGLVAAPVNEAAELVGAAVDTLTGADPRRGVNRRFVALHLADLDGTTLGDWHCVSPSGAGTPIDEDSACRWRYGHQALVANPAHFHAPWETWDCWG